MEKIYQRHPYRFYHNIVPGKAITNQRVRCGVCNVEGCEGSATRNIICPHISKLTSIPLSHETNNALKPKSRCFVCRTFSDGLNCATGRYNRKNCQHFELDGKPKCQLCIKYRSKEEKELNCGRKNVYEVHLDCKYFEFDGTRKN